MNDNLIRDEVLHELKWDPKITSSDIIVTVKDEVVTLSGFAPNYWEKLEAEKAVKRVRGVRGVANDIKIALSSKRTDPEIARDAVHELESLVGVPGNKIKVTVENGCLTLEGMVDWQSQKTLAESAVKKLKGVIEIVNRIELQPRVSAQEVKDRIEEALRRSAELDASHITVEIVGDTVNLYGSVRSWAEKSDAERAAWSTPGTADVKSNINININPCCGT
jgi:osmotically-inducible protein OsmY